MASLEFDVTLASAETFTGTYIFGSEEYYDFVGTTFFDAVAIFVNGQNIARTADKRIVNINTIN